MTYNEYANLFLEGSKMSCLYRELMVTRNMDLELYVGSGTSTTYQHRDSRYILSPPSTDNVANIMNTFTIAPGGYEYYYVGTMVRYGDYIYLRARSEPKVSPYTLYLVEYHIPTGTKITVPIQSGTSYTFGTEINFCPIAPHTLLLYNPSDYSRTPPDEYEARIVKVVFSESSATITTELEVKQTDDLYKDLDFLNVVEGTDEHLYAVAFGYYHSQLYDDDIPTPGGWLVYYKDLSASYGEWIELSLESIPSWDWLSNENSWKACISWNKIVVFAGLDDIDYNGVLSIVTFDVVAKTLVKIDDSRGWNWGSVEYVGPDLSTSNIYANYNEDYYKDDYPYSGTRSYIYKLDTSANTWEEVRYIGEELYLSTPPYEYMEYFEQYCAIFSSKTKAYFWNTITQDFYDATTNTLIGNITLPFTVGTQNTCLAIDDDDLIWHYEIEPHLIWRDVFNGVVKAKNFNNTLVYSIPLIDFAYKLYTNIHILNDYIVLETYSGFSGSKQQDYYIVKGVEPPPELPASKFNGIYVATRALGVYYSDYFHPDVVSSWAAVNSGLEAFDCREFHMDPFNPNDKQYVLLEASRILYRRDNGGSWTAILTPAMVNAMLSSTDSTISSFHVDPSIDGRLWALTGSPNVVMSYEGWNAMYSDDYGDTWHTTTKIHTAIDSYGMGTIAAYGNRVWFNAQPYWAKTFYSTNMGSTWGSDITEYPSISALGYNILLPDQAYVATDIYADLSRVINTGGVFELQAGLGFDRGDAMWFNPIDPSHQRLHKGMFREGQMSVTYDAWATISATYSNGGYCLAPHPYSGTSNITDILMGIYMDVYYGDVRQGHCIGYLNGEDDLTPLGIAGLHCDEAPYTNSIPYTCGGICLYGIGTIGI
jgi:hypothetical protein